MQKLRRLRFDGPYSGGRHLFMEKGERRIHIPNPHQSDVSRGLVKEILEHAGISKEEWERA